MINTAVSVGVWKWVNVHRDNWAQMCFGGKIHGIAAPTTCTISFSPLLLLSLIHHHHHATPPTLYYVASGEGLPPLDLCKTLDSGDYKRLLWTSASEVPGIFVTMLILPFIGRKIVMGIEMLVTTLFTGLLFICANE